MPELPEVETIVQGLRKKIKKRKIISLWTDWPSYFKLPKGEDNFKKLVIGRTILDVFRKAKNILISLSGDYLLLIHQKISGHLLVGRWLPQEKFSKKIPEIWQGEKWLPDAPFDSPFWDEKNRFIRLIFFLDNKEMLALSDLRRFAKVLVGPSKEILNLPELKDLGPEPLASDFNFEKFKKLFEKKKGAIKKILMDQSFISGIGNIYSDEILWLAKIHPLSRAEKLKEEELKKIFRAMKFILKKALKLKGTSIDEYRDITGQKGGYEKVRYVYQREKEACFRCQKPIQRIKINNRSSYFCSNCQILI